MRAATLLLALSACQLRDNLVELTPGWQRMVRQAKVDAYEDDPVREDGGGMRLPPAGTVAWDEPAADLPPATGWDAATLARGGDRFAIACRPCHGLDGRADTPVARNMELRPPPSLHEPRIVALSDDAIWAVIRHGYGLMPSYAEEVDAADAWAIVAWVRALQLAGGARLDALPPWAQAQAARELR